MANNTQDEPESYDRNRSIVEHEQRNPWAQDHVNPEGLGKGTLPNQPWARTLNSDSEAEDNAMKP